MTNQETAPEDLAVATSKPWVLYLLECENTAYYAGITNNMEARFKAHVRGKGAKYTRANKPLRILATRAFPDKSAAAKAEWAIKQLPRSRKLAFMHVE